MEFKTFRDRLQNHFESVMSDHDLFTTGIDKDELWNLADAPDMEEAQELEPTES